HFYKSKSRSSKSKAVTKVVKSPGDWEAFTLEGDSPKRQFGWTIQNYIRGQVVAELRNFKLELTQDGTTTTFALPDFKDWDKGYWEMYQEGLETEVLEDGSFRMSWKENAK
ncbi:MAG: hypothetical protein AAF570_00815, partial [Bacteroidota bacterium]